MKLSGFANCFKQLYTDKFANYRHINSAQEDGTTGISLEPTPVQSNVSCRISFKNEDNSEPTLEDRNPIYLGLKIFCSSEIDVKKGDKIIVDRLSDSGDILESYSGIANLPKMYTTHQEILLTEVGDA